MSPTRDSDYGVLVGWTAETVGDRVTLRLQRVTAPPPHGPDDVSTQYWVMDRTQAVQLGNFLFDLAEQKRPPRRRNWIERMLLP